MPASPQCLISEGGPFVPTTNGVDVTPGSTISIKLASSVDVSQWFLEVFGTDELSTTPALTDVNPTTHEVTSPSAIPTFTYPAAAGRAIVIRSTIVATTSQVLQVTLGIYTLAGSGSRVGAVYETMEGDLDFGWARLLNPFLRSGGSGFAAGGDLSGSAINQTVEGIQTRPVNPVLPTNLSALVWFDVPGEWRPTRLTEDMILPAFAISTFSPTVGTMPEVGQTVTTPAFTASYSLPAPYDYVHLSDSDNVGFKDVSGTPTAFASDNAFTKGSYGATVVFTLTASKDGFVKTRTYTMQWQQKVFWGASVAPGSWDDAFIHSLSNSLVTNTKNRTFSVDAGNPGDNKHIYYAYRTAYGASQFWVNGFQGGFTLVATGVPVNNGFVIENYDIYESNQVGLGLTDVTVTN